MAAAYTTSIALDLVADILLRLPLKSIMRFKSVSKQWKSLIESHTFVKRHLMKSSRRRSILLAFGCRDDGDDSPPFLFPDEDKDEEEEICYIGNCDASRISLTWLDLHPGL
ncbi:hypothetical protein CARUB_v10018606mg [Capsella rubella]|uniref:F-box domain-containing protein n=1 Tax=Capsella rubella TaxID=81985 RepID=R0FSA1_9BRAS|nr:hypothetical protein CARUB_v10018606mg [Capsella rubella]